MNLATRCDDNHETRRPMADTPATFCHHMPPIHGTAPLLGYFPLSTLDTETDMRPTRLVASTLIAAAAAFALAAPASAAPLMTGAALSQAAPSATVNVQHWRHRPHRHHYHGGGGSGALIGGLAAGAIIGGAIAASQAQAAQQAQQAHAYCAQRFRSYDPASGTYLGHDGYRHPCP